jgi:hypothetical protein
MCFAQFCRALDNLPLFDCQDADLYANCFSAKVLDRGDLDDSRDSLRADPTDLVMAGLG